jgi:hypothetical protein
MTRDCVPYRRKRDRRTLTREGLQVLRAVLDRMYTILWSLMRLEKA